MGKCPICSDNRKKRRVSQTSPEESPSFPKGEHYYQIINDVNIGQGNNIPEKDKTLSEKIELFFTLDNVCNPKDENSFGISIINNKKIGNKTFLGNLEDAKGEKIKFGTSFTIDFFFEREQIIIIEPRINGKKTGQKNEFVLCTLMTKRENKIKIENENIGNLEINYKKLNNKDNQLTTEISCYQFYIKLDNKILII